MGNFLIPLPPKLFLRILMLLFLVVHNANSQYAEGNRRLKPCELETLLRDLTYPEEGYEMHAAALRNQLRHILEREPTADSGYQSLDDYGTYDNSGPYEDKRSYRSLLREGATFGKRNLGSLARAGLLRTPSTDYLKRSIATLAKNGQLPASREPDSEEAASAGGWNDEKRNLASARASGYMLNGKRNIASLARKYELPGKRNIQSLLRTGMLPSIAPKRNMQSLARDNSLPHFAGASAQESKRNIQTLVRDWNLPRQQSVATDNEKRNIQSLKHSQGGQGGGSANGGGRKKRELYYEDETLDDSAPEILEPVYQSAPLDYEELMEAMNEAYTPYYNSPVGNHVEEKRYLGSLARAGILHRYHRFYKRTPLASFDDLYGNDDDDDDDNVDDTNNDEGEISHKRKHGSKDGLVQDDDDDDDDNDEDYKPTSSVALQSPQKRHLGSIIRSGWMPSFRPSRTAGRFSRSGRARSSFTPNPSDYDNLSPAFVDDATALATAADFEQHQQQQQHPLPSTAGEVPVYSQRWVLRHPELPRYTGAAFGNRPRTYGGGPPEEYPYYDSSSETSARPPNPFYSEDEFRCAARLRKLLYYLKKQYYLDNKYIQSVYGRNPVRY